MENDNLDRFYTSVILLLNRSFSGDYMIGHEVYNRGWVLTGQTLAHFIVNYSLRGCREIHVEAAGSMEIFKNLGERIGTLVKDSTLQMPSGAKIIIHGVRSINKYLDEFPIDFERCKVRVPVNLGKRCDEWNLDWAEKIKRFPKPEPQYAFFDKKRRENARELVSKMLQCGEKVGIKNKMFIGFGGCLGYALRGDFLPNDNDIDMCIHSDGITQNQIHQYLMECKKAGITETRLRGPVSIDGKYVWFSLGEKSISQEHGVKSCNWFWFNFGGFSWHSKGKKWIGRRGLSEKYITAKGIPQALTAELKTVKFGGTVDVQIPKRLGECLDYWYPGWIVRKNEKSRIKSVLYIPKESDKKTWYIEKNS